MQIKPYRQNLSKQLHSNLLTSPMQAQISFHVAANTYSTLQTYTEGITRLMRLTEKARMLTQQRLAVDPNYTFGRGIGVKLAWEYEKLDFKLGGKGSESWMSGYKDEILQTGKVSGAEGHHAQNVADHPMEQSNPNNIKFYKNKEDHLNYGHGGDFHNESDMPMIDRPKMVKNTKDKTIAKNELKGVGIAAIIGMGTSVTMSYIIELSKNGISYESIKEATKVAAVNGLIGAGLGAGSYLLYRGIEIAVDYAIRKLAIQLSERALKGVKGGIPGGILIAGTSVYGYMQLRKEGYSIQDSLIETGKQSAYPTATLALSLCFPGPIGVGIGIVSTLGYMGYSIFEEYCNQKLKEELLILQLNLMIIKMSQKAA